MSGTDVAGLISAINNKDSGSFGENWIWIIGLLIVAGIFGGGSWFGNRSNGTIANDNLLGEEFIKRDIFNTNQNVSNTGCQTQRDVLESRYATQLGLDNLGAKMQSCCCETEKEILQNRYDNALQTNTLQAQMSTNALQNQMQLAECCCNLRAEGLANTQKIIDLIQQEKIDQLREQVNTSNLALFGANLATQITNSIIPKPVPAYPSCSPFMTTTYGCNNGCGNTLY